MMTVAPAPARLREPPLTLVRRSLGSPAEISGKVARLARILSGYAQGHALDERLQRLCEAGTIERAPSRPQLLAGSVDMLRFWISPAAADYYDRQGISYAFHQLLRFLDEPASLADPVGFFSTRDNIIGHLMQVVHANPVYDLQLLTMFEDGLDSLEGQLEEMIAGTHPRARAIQAIVEEADYHQALLEFVRAWRRDPSTPPLLRSNVAESTDLGEAQETFGTLPAAMRYFCTLPDTWLGAAWHLLTVHRLPAVEKAS
jgi:hypothetical protein